MELYIPLDFRHCSDSAVWDTVTVRIRIKQLEWSEQLRVKVFNPMVSAWSMSAIWVEQVVSFKRDSPKPTAK